MKALCLFRNDQLERQADFEQGLSNAGYHVVKALKNVNEDDVIIMWNRRRGDNELARIHEANGGRVVVAENGYLGKAWKGSTWFALSLGHHAGAGVWPQGGDDRWDSWQIELQPWREGGKEVIVFGQRGIGEAGLASPPGWAEMTAGKVRGRVRPHPGRNTVKPLEEDLKNAKCAVTWASAAALKALLFGVPVYYECESWIGGEAALPLSQFSRPPKKDEEARLRMFRRLAWAQWSIDEIRSGEAFNRLQGCSYRV